jgi:predicted ribosome quality control (RQC) complex YloA/Tae2 family protein
VGFFCSPSPVPPSWSAIVEDLQRLAGSKIQRVDRFDEHGLMLELRVPGRTLRLVIEPGRVGLVSERPRRRVEGGDLQRFLRKRLVGATWITAERFEGRLRIGLDVGDLWFDPRGGRRAWSFEAASAPRSVERSEVPEHLPSLQTDAPSPASDPERRRRAHLRVLHVERKRLQRLLTRVEADAERMARLAAESHQGELLKTELHRVRRGQARIEVTDWSTGEARTLDLDPRRSPVENLERIFARAKKGARGRPVAERRAQQARARVEEIEARIEAMTRADPDHLPEWEPDSKLSAAPPGSSSSALRRHPLDAWSRRFEAVDGTEIRVGKNARGNDRLTLQGARGHDRWLHARGVTGAHVVLRVERGQEPRPEALLDAAHLAVHYSELNGEAKADVLVAEARHVKKTKGSAPGRVGVAKSRTLPVTMERERLQRLLGQTGPDRVR